LVDATEEEGTGVSEGFEVVKEDTAVQLNGEAAETGKLVPTLRNRFSTG